MSESHTTTDHHIIQKWATDRDGRPATVKATEADGHVGILRIDFDPESEGLDEIEWKEFSRNSTSPISHSCTRIEPRTARSAASTNLSGDHSIGETADAVADKALATSDWVAAMRAGDFARAWQISDRDVALIRRIGPPKHEGPRHLQRIWRGERLQGRRVLVRCYHGLGDTIQFARFLAPLRRLAREVIVWCQSELLPLIETVEGVDRVLPLHDGAPDAKYDVDIEIMEIPHAIRASREQVGIIKPYLKAPPSDGLLETDPGTLSVGLVWDVGNWDRRRVIPLRLLEQLGSSGVQLYSLQRGCVPGAAGEIGAIDISTPDVEILAGRLRKLDLCVCPDTMVAHLAGALGCETWVMLHADCDWRWPAAGRRTVWYPSARLFRQHLPGDWRGTVKELRSAISDRIGEATSNVSLIA